MTLADYRTQNRRRRRVPLLGIVSVLVLIVAIALLGQQWLEYQRTTNDDTLGEDVIIGGVQVGGLASDERLARLEAVYVQQPVTLYYGDSPILLSPADVEFTLDTEAMQSEANRQLDASDSIWQGFVDYLRNRTEPAVDVDLAATYSTEAVRAFLADVARRYDTLSQTPGFDLTTRTFSGTAATTQLDVEAAVPLIEAALFATEADERVVELPVETIPGQTPSMDTLRQALIDYMANQGIDYNSDTTMVSVFVMDLETGEEMGIQENVQFSAVSTIKLPVLINYFRAKITSPPDEEKLMLAGAVICSRNNYANELMHIASTVQDDGSYAGGARTTTQTACEAGAPNTAIRSSLFNGTRDELRASGFNPDFYYAVVPETPCPVAGPEPDSEARVPAVDDLNKTTSADMGTLLMLTYDCAMHGSGLRTIFPDEITQTECQWILEIMKGTNFERLSELGTPSDVPIAHKVGYDGSENVSDISIVYSPGGDYIYNVYIWAADPELDGVMDLKYWDLVGELGQIVYNYFNPDDPLLEPRQPYVYERGAACVLPRSGSLVNLNDIDENRFDESGDPVPSACYDFPDCLEFRGWGNNPAADQP